MNFETQHTIGFRDRQLLPGEKIVAFITGWIDDGMSAPSIQTDVGAIILTDQRICHYRTGRFGAIHSDVSLTSIVGHAVEQATGHRRLRLMLPGRNILIKSFDDPERFASFISAFIQYRVISTTAA